MEENKIKEEKKPTYEELEKILIQRNYEINKLYEALQNENYEHTCTTLSFLFKVLELSNHFPVEYVENVASEIQNMLTPASAEAQSDAAFNEGA